MRWCVTKSSRYNHFFPLDSGFTLVFNGLRGSFLKLDSSARKLYKQIERGQVPSLDYEGAEADLNKLKESGVIVDDGFDEFQYLRVMYQVFKFGSSTLSVTLAPTLNCNFRCSYCYEEKSNARMTPEVQKRILVFVGEQLKSMRHLDVIWYGGEPLLEKEVVLGMAEKLRILCKERDCKYTSSMITNGYLLDRSLALKLREQGVAHLQVTLDGPPSVHDTRRVLVNGEGTFTRIINNIRDVVDVIPGITVRVNTDKTNAGRVVELLDLLAEYGLKNKVNVHFAPVLSTTKACQDISAHCFTSEEYSALEVKLCKEAVERGFRMTKYPVPMLGGCGSLYMHSFLIDPSGDLYKCWNTLGLAGEKVGDVENPDKFFMNGTKWLLWDPFSFRKCRGCSLLPVCIGGCPYQTLHRNLKEPECREWKNNLKEMLMLYYMSYVQRKSALSQNSEKKTN